ncbi:MAG: hypothetical protein R3C02_18780 [Planctomycetaceae bacterium]
MESSHFRIISDSTTKWSRTTFLVRYQDDAAQPDPDEEVFIAVTDVDDTAPSLIVPTNISAREDIATGVAIPGPGTFMISDVDSPLSALSASVVGSSDPWGLFRIINYGETSTSKTVHLEVLNPQFLDLEFLESQDALNMQGFYEIDILITDGTNSDTIEDVMILIENALEDQEVMVRLAGSMDPADVIVDGSTTPIDFGTAVVGDTALSRTF